MNLERFWIPAGKSYSVTDSGWLIDPSATGFFATNVDAIPTREFAGLRCVVLLGEPGMGKTSAIASGGPLTTRHQTATTLHFDLGRFSSEDRLARHVLENHEVTSWQSGSGMLCLTLDSFDEARNRIETLDGMLADYLDGWDCDRLLLRIVCRTADWPQSLGQVLEEQFGDANVHELLPLRRSDAATLLRAGGMNAEAFLAAAESARVVPLAARPLTLNLLRAAIGPDGTFPNTTAKLFERGLLALADEMNPQRRGTVATPGSAMDRLSAASRIAAISIFGGRPTVWIGPVVEADPSDITVDDCVGSAPGPGGRPHRAETVEVTLRSGIFSGGGDSRLTWSHATFADYLAARWAVANELSDAQIRSLLLSNDGRIHLRVRQVAAWLISLDSDRFRGFIQCDPEAFLANVDLPDESLRFELVDAILNEAGAGDLYDDYALDYSGLQHVGLADQLRPVLLAADGEATRIALRIARQCSVVGSLPDLTALALNDVADPVMRASAALVIHDLSTANPSHDLITLLRPSSDLHGDDVSRRELQAAALMASWPHAVSTAEVFDLLAPRHPPNFIGLYSVFVDHFARNLTADDLEPACDWLLADPSRTDDSRLTSLTQAILRICSENLDHPRARAAITTVALRRADEYQPLFSDPALETESLELETEKRRAIALLLLEKANEEQIWSIVQSFHGQQPTLIQDDDLAWLLDSYASTTGVLQENIGRALTLLYRPEHIPHSTLVLELEESHPATKLFAYWRSVIEMDSPEATAAKNAWKEHAERRRVIERRRQVREPRDEWVNPRIAEDVAKARLGDVAAFWNAARLVTVRPGTTRYMDEYQPDLTAHPRWQTLRTATRQDFITAAPIYLERGKCQPERWLTRDVMFFPAQAGYRALLLLLRENPTALTQLSPDVWREWAPILVEWTVTINGAQVEDKRELLRHALPHARSELTAAALTLVDKAISEGTHVFRRTELDVLSSSELASELTTRLEGAISTETRNAILDAIIENYGDLVVPLLRRWLGETERSERSERARDAVIRLLHHDAEAAWPQLHELMEVDPDFMESALLNGALSFDRRVPDLPERDLASLYIWLSQHFPSSEDPQFEDAHYVGPREAVGNWRDSILNTLTRMGTTDAVEAIKQIASTLHGEAWLGRVLVNAKRAAREGSWEPIEPYELDQIAASRESRIVRTDADLLDTALAALDEIQARLQADTPSANLLWDTHSGRPKSEEELSDFLAIELNQRLQRRGAIVNREVQVRRIKPTGLPERTDLRIEALPVGESGEVASHSVRIPGEVKGAWNAGAIDAVESQLVQRYMADFHTDYGIYIVAWFDPASWTAESDGRRSKAAKYDGIDALRSTLQAEADKQRERGRHIAAVVLDVSLRRQPSA